MSSHVLAELERVADYMIVMSRGGVQVAGEVDHVLASHCVLTGPADEVDRLAQAFCVVQSRAGSAQAHLLVRTNATVERLPAGWETHPVGLEELTLAYLGQPDACALPRPPRPRIVESPATTT
jgi:ABC-2 type transport system ATP-binding protein